MIDSEERASNIMISGLKETNITFQADPETTVVLKDDDSKVKHILDTLDTDVTAAHIQECKRIGNAKPGYTRLLKIKVAFKDQKKLILDNSRKLKGKEHLKTVYVKKDTHPVYVQETNRLRIKMKKLLDIPENKDKVKIIDGNLEVDGVIVDKNMFFV